MKIGEKIKEFYTRIGKDIPEQLDNKVKGHINIFQRKNCNLTTPYSKKDYYKVSLILGNGRLQYANKYVNIDKPTLLFSNPMIPYSWEPDTAQYQEGWFCIFTDNFIQDTSSTINLQKSPLFRIDGTPVFFVNENQRKSIADIFQKMALENDSDYVYKYDTLRAYLHLLFHEAMKMKAADNFNYEFSNASYKITTLFLELLERQFPIDNVKDYIKLKTPNDFAENLSVHPNSLNRSVKEITGKTTGQQICSRIIQEAIVLLKFTDWSISEIALCLGFEEPAYFAHYFKKQTGMPPNTLRKLNN